jgi:hypothetical protein
MFVGAAPQGGGIAAGRPVVQAAASIAQPIAASTTAIPGGARLAPPKAAFQPSLC